MHYMFCNLRRTGQNVADFKLAITLSNYRHLQSPSRKIGVRSLVNVAMKRFNLLVSVFMTLFVCVGCEIGSDGEFDDAVTVDFEEAELGTLVLDGYNPATYEDVLAGKAQASLCNDADNQLNGCLLFDGILYSENGANFGSFFSDFKALWGGTFDTTYAFVISSNNDMEVATVHNQYSVYSATNGDNKFAVAYDGTWWSPTYQNRYGEYDLPTIVFDKPVEPLKMRVANTTYAYLQIMKNDPNMCFAIKAMGYLDGVQTSEVSFSLASFGNVVADWKTIVLHKLDKVDKICFTVDWERTSSEVKAPEEWCPFSFCIDDLQFDED